MMRYFVRRVARGMISLFGVVVVTFILLRLSGDPVTLFVGQSASPDQVEQIRHQLGLDQPLLVQFGRYVSNAVRGDFGQSLRMGEPAMSLVFERLPITAALATIALGLALVVGVPLGIWAARKAGSPVDRVILGAAVLGQSIPSFWLGVMLILLVAVQLKWLPTSGLGSPRHFILPGITLAGFSLGSITRLSRSGMMEALTQDYVRTARAKGLSERAVLTRHAFRNALLSVTTFTGLQLGVLMGGAVITEEVFAIPGVGRLLVDSIFNRDYAVVQAAVVVLATAIILLNVIVDILYSVLDPRIRVA